MAIAIAIVIQLRSGGSAWVPTAKKLSSMQKRLMLFSIIKLIVLTLEHYNAIHAKAEPWLQAAMDFSLITLQRRGDVVNSKYSDIHGDELKIIQQKTERHGERAFLRIRIGSDLNEVIMRSRQIQPVCPYIIHRMPDRKIKFDGQEHWA
jgi:enterobacteria phage integrase